MKSFNHTSLIFPRYGVATAMLVVSLIGELPNLLKIIPSQVMVCDTDVSVIDMSSPISSDSDGVAKVFDTAILQWS